MSSLNLLPQDMPENQVQVFIEIVCDSCEKMKLVRDKIPEIMKSAGKNPTTHTASDEEYWEKLKEKLSEEVNEFLNDSSKEELADILEVINAICYFKDISMDEIEFAMQKKAEKKGIFNDKIILE